MKKANYIVFDCETGGLDRKKNPILEIALVTLDGDTLEEIKRYETYVQVYDDLIVEKEALAANGIKMRDVEQHGISKKQFCKDITAYFKGSMPGSHPSLKPVVVGHNIPFDIGFMDEAFKDEKVKFSDLRAPIFHDTMLDAKRVFTKSAKINLGTCCELAGIKLVNAHRAMPDVLATADLFRYFTKRIMNDSSSKSVKVDKNEVPSSKSRTKFQF